MTEDCLKFYIPDELKSKGKPYLPEFHLNELLYWRCSNELVINPFTEINLYDVSINRQGNPQKPISKKEDVLWDISESEQQKYNKGIVDLIIKKIEKPYYYKIVFSETDILNNIYVVVMELFHAPLPCMYPHSEFRFTINGEKVTKNNYENTFKKGKNKALKILRNKFKNELANMIFRREVEF